MFWTETRLARRPTFKTAVNRAQVTHSFTFYSFNTNETVRRTLQTLGENSAEPIGGGYSKQIKYKVYFQIKYVLYNIYYMALYSSKKIVS